MNTVASTAQQNLKDLAIKIRKAYIERNINSFFSDLFLDVENTYLNLRYLLNMINTTRRKSMHYMIVDNVDFEVVFPLFERFSLQNQYSREWDPSYANNTFRLTHLDSLLGCDIQRYKHLEDIRDKMSKDIPLYHKRNYSRNPTALARPQSTRDTGEYRMLDHILMDPMHNTVARQRKILEMYKYQPSNQNGVYEM